MKLLSLFAQASDQYDLYSNESMNNAGSQLSDDQQAGVFLFSMLFGFLIFIVVYVIGAILLSRIFKKAGVEQWKAWVPIYNNWVFLELGGQQGFWAVLAIIPIVSIVSAVFMFIAAYHIGLKLGKEGWFVLLAIFLPIVWLIWLAVDNSTWRGAPKSEADTNLTPPIPPTTPPVGPTTPTNTTPTA